MKAGSCCRVGILRNELFRKKDIVYMPQSLVFEILFCFLFAEKEASSTYGSKFRFLKNIRALLSCNSNATIFTPLKCKIQ